TTRGRPSLSCGGSTPGCGPLARTQPIPVRNSRGGISGTMSSDAPNETGGISMNLLKIWMSGLCTMIVCVVVMTPPANSAQPAEGQGERLGELIVAPEDLFVVGSRFAGEVVEIGACRDRAGRTLQVGDKVVKGDLLAVVWSRDLASKKAAFVEAVFGLRLEQERLQHLMNAKGVVPESAL